MARKRSLIETVNDPLKNISQIAHTRHRRVENFMVNLMAGLLAYTFQPKNQPCTFLTGRPGSCLPSFNSEFRILYIHCFPITPPRIAI
jgi:hypothetical protein